MVNATNAQLIIDQNFYSDFQASYNEKASSVKRQALSFPDYHVSATVVTALVRARVF